MIDAYRVLFTDASLALSGWLRILGVAGCAVLGAPAQHGRFGFTHVGDLVHPGAPPEYILALAFQGSFPHGEVAYHVAFASGA